MQLDKSLRIVIPVLIVLAIVLAALLPWRCSAQTAGTIDFSRDYSAKLDEIMTEQYGADWKRLVRDNWAEAWKNLTSSAREQYRERRGSLFDDEGLEKYLTQQEARQVARALDSARARKTVEEVERQRADSIAAAQQTQGAVISREDTPQLAGLGIGKMLSPRMEITDGWIDEGGGGGGGAPITVGHGLERAMGEGLAKLAVYTVVGVAVIVLVIYGIVRLAR